mmetsp:Transcript_6647/g.16377  ORF Transcript_6647/g.16377 Transcript_6647/m.16377 type:complete len:405 (-) Transcript_6647:4763-5977(-)
MTKVVVKSFLGFVVCIACISLSVQDGHEAWGITEGILRGAFNADPFLCVLESFDAAKLIRHFENGLRIIGSAGGVQVSRHVIRCVHKWCLVSTSVVCTCVVCSYGQLCQNFICAARHLPEHATLRNGSITQTPSSRKNFTSIVSATISITSIRIVPWVIRIPVHLEEVPVVVLYMGVQRSECLGFIYQSDLPGAIDLHLDCASFGGPVVSFLALRDALNAIEVAALHADCRASSTCSGMQHSLLIVQVTRGPFCDEIRVVFATRLGRVGQERICTGRVCPPLLVDYLLRIGVEDLFHTRRPDIFVMDGRGGRCRLRDLDNPQRIGVAFPPHTGQVLGQDHGVTPRAVALGDAAQRRIEFRVGVKQELPQRFVILERCIVVHELGHVMTADQTVLGSLPQEHLLG